MANSYIWKYDVERIIGNYYDLVQKTEFSDIIKFHPDRVKNIYENYDSLLKSTREEMNLKTDDYVDHHKIIAMYVKSILLANIFEFDDKYYYSKKDSLSQKPCIITLYPNYYICWQMVLTMITGWSKTKDGKNIGDYITRYPDSIYCYKNKTVTKYDGHFIKLLHAYRRDPESISIFSLSHILFFIELACDCSFYNKKHHYYKHYT